MARGRNVQSKSKLEVLLAFIFGVVFISVLLYLATIEKNPTPLAVRVYVTVLTLAGGGVGAVIPGFFDIQFKNLARGGGALGLTALIYLSEPAIGKNVVQLVPPKEPPQPVASEFLRAIDSGDPGRPWRLLPDLAREQVNGSEDEWDQLYKTDIQPLGKVQSRILTGQGQAESPTGTPLGLYHWFIYKTKYANDSGSRQETVTVRANSDQNWEVYSYVISPYTLPGT